MTQNLVSNVQWEYKTVKIDPTVKSIFGTKGLDPDKVFNELGAEGWELVSTFNLTVAAGKVGIQAIFKRPKEAI
jgi:hypothetical protein